MKLIIMPFMRKRPRRKPSHMELTTNWTSRDWADMPTHHPKRDER